METIYYEDTSPKPAPRGPCLRNKPKASVAGDPEWGKGSYETKLGGVRTLIFSCFAGRYTELRFLSK